MPPVEPEPRPLHLSLGGARGWAIAAFVAGVAILRRVRRIRP